MVPVVSVVIPTYNRAALLARAVYSVYSQTVSELEIIVVDDCSTDDTEEQLERLQDRYPALRDRLVYVRQPVNRGANAARNVGVFRATGRYIAFLDSDDIWHPDKLMRQLRRIDRAEDQNWGHRPYFCFTGRYRVDDHYRIIARQFAGSMKNATTRILRSNSIGTLSSIMLTSWVARHVGGFDESLPACQDWDFYVRTLPFCQVVGVRDPLVLYFDGDIQRISKQSRSRLLSHLVMYRRHIRGRVSEEGLEELYRNVAEDLEGLNKPRLARHFYLKHKRLRRDYGGLARAMLETQPLGVRDERYRAYERRESERRNNQASEDACYMNEYRRIIEFKA